MKRYYAGHSYMGINYTFDSPCWKVYAFESKTMRDNWVKENEYSHMAGRYVATAITFKDVQKILGRENDWHKYTYDLDGRMRRT